MKFTFTSLGCPRNLVDSEVMIALLNKKGLELTFSYEKADLHIVNTCGFIKEAREEALDVLEEIFKSKKKTAKVIAVGCMVQKFSSMLKGHFPDIHFYLGSGDVEKIVEAAFSLEKGSIISDKKSYLSKERSSEVIVTPQNYAYVKIAEGCKKGCSYCLIPQIKGQLKSKSKDLILKEIDTLLKAGVKEIILIAQDLGDYGKDLTEKTTLVDLVKDILKIKKDFWLRLLYVYPDEINDELIELFKTEDRLCSYVDMPIQHVNDDILKFMKRKVTKKDIINTIEKLRQVPDMIIRTSIIVGFPSETEAQFEELVHFIKTNPIDHVGIFKYSNEEGTISSKMPDQIEDSIKDKRYQKLAKVQSKIAIKNQRKLIGKTILVNIEGYHQETDLLMVGRYQGQAPEIDTVVIINDPSYVDQFNKLYPVKIIDIKGCDLVGHVKC